VRRLVADGLDGDVLVFLPGAAEIRRALAALAPLAARADLLVVPLHGEQGPAEQDRALRPAERRKVILSTNVAESSVTIEGVAAVVDSGLARVAGCSPWSGLPSLRVAKVSRASAAQRAGRAGRTRAGRALRLYTRHDHDGRPEQQPPEILRLDLAEPLLHARAIAGAEPLPWLDAPPPAAAEAAETLLVRLGALDGTGAVTPLGRRMLRLPLHPRLARIVCEGEERGVLERACMIATLLGERGLQRRGPFQEGGGRAAAAATSGPSDLLDALERLDEEQAPALRRAHAQLLRRCRRDAPPPDRGPNRDAKRPGAEEVAQRSEPADADAALGMAVLAGYPDRVARRRATAAPGRARGGPPPAAPEVLLSGGGSAALSPQSVVREAELLVVVEAEEGSRAPRESGGAGVRTIVHAASAIEPEWLLELFPDALREVEALRWDAAAERVESVRQLLYDRLVLEERASAAVDPARAEPLLVEAALAAGPRRFADPEALDRFAARVALVAEHRPDAGLRVPDESALRDALTALCRGHRSFAELPPLLDALRAALTPAQAQLVERLAPERVSLPGGRALRIDYAAGRPPSVASRLQDFFGLAEGPRIAGGALPLVLHLLAPNQRAVQVTADLAGFWQRHYPSLRRELCRRYPKHAWPDDPLHAAPPSPKRR
jgi:ATP-dependent helicase HrpB